MKAGNLICKGLKEASTTPLPSIPALPSSALCITPRAVHIEDLFSQTEQSFNFGYFSIPKGDEIIGGTGTQQASPGIYVVCAYMVDMRCDTRWYWHTPHPHHHPSTYYPRPPL